MTAPKPKSPWSEVALKQDYLLTLHEVHVPSGIQIASHLPVAVHSTGEYAATPPPDFAYALEIHDTTQALPSERRYVRLDGTFRAPKGSGAAGAHLVAMRDLSTGEQQFRLYLIPSAQKGWDTIKEWIDPEEGLRHGPESMPHFAYVKRFLGHKVDGQNRRVADPEAFLKSPAAVQMLGKETVRRITLVKEQYEAGLLQKPLQEMKDDLNGKEPLVVQELIQLER